MQLIDGAPVYSATDLVGFLACEHLTNLERAAIAGLVERPHRVDPELDRIAQRGIQHEQRFLAGLRAQGLRIVEVAEDPEAADWGADLRRRAAETLAAMRVGADVIYQATFLEPVLSGLGAGQGEADTNRAGTNRAGANVATAGNGPPADPAYWLGFADFLRRVDAPSELGTWSYEAWDTKLARHVKASAVLQLCVYSDLLERVQGVRPGQMHVALGGSARAVEHLRTADYAAYYRLVRDRFVAFVGAGADVGAGMGDAAGVPTEMGAPARHIATAPTYPPPTRPDPVEHCDVCRWQADCARWRRQHDDLSLVANISTRQRRALREHEPPVDTRRKLAAATLPLEPPLPKQAGVRDEGLRVVHEQARIQVAGEEAGRTLHELLDPPRLEDGTLEPDRGLLGLPEPSPGDLFLDLEGDPFAFDDGIDYLFGIIEPGLPEGAPDSREVVEATTDSGPRAAEPPVLPSTNLPRRPDDLPPADAPVAAFEQLRWSDVPASTPGSGTDDPTFHAIWSFDDDHQVTPAGEKRAFERVIDLIVDRRQHDPDMHVFHYAAYEPTAMGRLSERYHTREEEVDALLRAGVFVDLFRVVRQSLRASVESYSIKKLEPLYGLTREVDLRDAGSSVVAFETWLELGEDEAGQGPEILDRIERYNRDDCMSNWRLRDWLEARRPELAARIGVDAGNLPRPVRGEEKPAEWLWEYIARVRALEARLTAGIPTEQLAEPARMSVEDHARWLLAQLLEWHRREDKSDWWEFHRLMRLTDEQFVEERAPLGGLEQIGEPRAEKRSLVFRYRFPDQEHDIQPGTDVYDPTSVSAATPFGESPGEVFAVDNVEGWIELKRGQKKLGLPHPRSLVPRQIVGTPEQRESLLRVGGWVADHGIGADGPYRAVRDLLLRRPPRFVDPAAIEGTDLRLPGEHGAQALRRLAPALDHSYLAVQGPPGSGKTTAGGELIVDLVERGCRVGVTANSHKVIGNLLDKVAAKARARGVAVRIGQKPRTGDDPTCTDARSLGSNDDLRDALANREIDVVGATAWAWAREGMAGSVDLLVVDEAGQVSLANLVAVAPAADNLVLLGDPQQLEQPLKGAHPPGAETSALGHLLGTASTMPPHLGLLLEETWRLHPSICRYTSEVFYAGELRPAEGTDRQALAGPGRLDGVGIRWVPVTHAGRRNESPEEADLICDLLADLRALGGTFTDMDGELHSLSTADALVITPYNAQVRAIARSIPGVRVGTVDKFQGQEAPISIYSMATSSAAEAPRGMEFLYSLNRLNVASSRARCLTLVVASPELIRVQCRTPRQMRLANALARLVEMGEGGMGHP